MSKQRRKGTSFERDCADYLSMRLGDEIDRMPLHGSSDRGDISGLKLRGMRCAVECKDQKTYRWAEYFDEMLDEKANYDADIGICVFHKEGVGASRFGRNYVLMELDDLLAVAVGGHRLLYGRPCPSVQAAVRKAVKASPLSIRQVAIRAGVDEVTVKNLLYKDSAVGWEQLDAIGRAVGE